MNTWSASKDISRVLKVGYLYHSGMSQSDIVRQLGLSASMVSRLVAESAKYIELRFNVPELDELESRLIERYGLAEAVIMETGSEEQAVQVVGQAAARYFLTQVENGDTVALSCGETLLEMLMSIPIQRNRRLVITQLSIEGDPEAIHQAPSTLVGLLRAKCSPDSKVLGLQLPPMRVVPRASKFRSQLAKSDIVRNMVATARNARFVFIGVGSLKDTTGQNTPEFVRLANIATDGTFSKMVDKLRLAGEINNQVFDRYGKDLTKAIPDLGDHFVNILTLRDIARIAADRQHKRVVLVATGRRKWEAMKAALTAKFANVLVTGRMDAEYLMK